MAFVQVAHTFFGNSAHRARAQCPASYPKKNARTHYRASIQCKVQDVAETKLLEEYVNLVQGERQSLMELRSIQELSATDDSALVLAFLMFLSARGVRITRPVEGWIRRAGERCKKLGHASLGDNLISHSREEAGHEKMFEQDTACLVGRWNRAVFPRDSLHANDLLKGDYLNPGEHAYIALHESIIQSTSPYLQIPIQSEIERLSLVLVPVLFEAVKRCLGA